MTDYSTLAVTAYQWIYQALTVKTRKEEVLGPLSVARVVAEFSQQAQVAADSKPVTVDMMNVITAMHHHAVKVPDIVAV